MCLRLILNVILVYFILVEKEMVYFPFIYRLFLFWSIVCVYRIVCGNLALIVQGRFSIFTLSYSDGSVVGGPRPSHTNTLWYYMLHCLIRSIYRSGFSLLQYFFNFNDVTPFVR